MRRRWAAALLAMGVARSAVAVEPLPAAPAPPPPPVVLVQPLPPAPAPGSGVGPPLAGVATAVLPFVAGCVLWAENDRRDLQRTGTLLMTTGFAAAPWVSHGLQRNWRRAAIFGSISAALSAATVIAMAAEDPFNPDIKNKQRVAFGVLLTTAMFGAAVGVFESFRAAGAQAEGSPL
jgi:hypothetical protein